MKRVTSNDVAKLAGVSQSSVSLILNNKNNVSFSQDTINKVIEVAKQLNYKPELVSNIDKTEKSNLIALLVPTVANPYYPLLTQTIQENANMNGYNVILCNTHRNKDIEKYYLEQFSNKCVDGLIYCFSPSFPEFIQGIAQKLPVAIIGEKDDSLKIDTIGLNSHKAGILIAEHLISLGHKDIAFISTPIDNTTLSRKKRLNGIIDKLKEYNLDNNLIIKMDDNEYESASGVYEIDVGYNLTIEVINEKSITAIIAVNDMIACGVINALNKKGIKVPQQISVCSFDNIFTSSIVSPSITTIDHCVQHRSKIVVDVLLEKIAKSNKSNSSYINEYQGIYKIEYEPQLIVRESTSVAKV
jgi:LacI family transcriptional regulator